MYKALKDFLWYKQGEEIKESENIKTWIENSLVEEIKEKPIVKTIKKTIKKSKSKK